MEENQKKLKLTIPIQRHERTPSALARSPNIFAKFKNWTTKDSVTIDSYPDPVPLKPKESNQYYDSGCIRSGQMNSSMGSSSLDNLLGSRKTETSGNSFMYSSLDNLKHSQNPSFNTNITIITWSENHAVIRDETNRIRYFEKRLIKSFHPIEGESNLIQWVELNLIQNTNSVMGQSLEDLRRQVESAENNKQTTQEPLFGSSARPTQHEFPMPNLGSKRDPTSLLFAVNSSNQNSNTGVIPNIYVSEPDLQESQTATSSPVSSTSPTSLESIATNSTESNGKQVLLYPNKQNDQQVLSPSNPASTVSVNLFGMQNTALHFNVHDILGLGQLGTSIAYLFEINRRFLEDSTRSKWLRLFVLFWEIVLFSVCIWQLIRIISTFGIIVQLFVDFGKDGLEVLEITGKSVLNIFSGFVWFGKGLLMGFTEKKLEPVVPENNIQNWFPEWIRGNHDEN